MTRLLSLLVTLTLCGQLVAHAQSGVPVGTRQGLIYLKSGSGLNIKTCVQVVMGAAKSLGYQVSYSDGSGPRLGSVEARTPQKVLVNVVCNSPGQEIFMGVFATGDATKYLDKTLVQLGDEITDAWVTRK